MAEQVKKLVRDGKVAVVYSPGYGAGWSTWNQDDCAEALACDAEIAAAVLDGDTVRAIERAAQIDPSLYSGGAVNLSVRWVKQGQAFRIDEYDGNETVQVFSEMQHWIA